MSLVRPDVSEEHIALTFRVKRVLLVRSEDVPHDGRIREPLATAPPQSCLSLPSVLTSATRRNIPEDGILHSHRRGNLKSYIALTGWTL
jgi:hypothetical protein